MYRVIVPCCAAALLLAGCAQQYASKELGVSGPSDPSVTVFRADRERAWRRFRLGGGLNVVVVNPQLPREFAWRFPTGAISSSPTVMGTTLLVSANDDHVYALDAATGTLRWKYRAENQVMSQPAYAGGLVFVGIGNAEDLVYDVPHYMVVGTGMNKLEAIDATNGIEQWWSALAGSGMPSAAILGNNVISIDGSGTLLAVGARSGRLQWYSRLETSAAMSSVVDGGRSNIYVSGGFPDAAYALDTKGHVLWEHVFTPVDGGISDDPLALTPQSLIGDYVAPTAPGPFGITVTYGSYGQQHAYALDRRSGRLLWDRVLPGALGFVEKYNESAVELVYRGNVYVGSAISPVVSALDARSGRILWQLRAHGPVKGGIAARDGVLYFGDLGGYLWAVDARSGHPIGSVSTDLRFNVGSPIIVNDSLVDGGTHDVIAVPLAAIRGSHQVPGITRLTVWERIGRWFAQVMPHRDPHREASYYR